MKNRKAKNVTSQFTDQYKRIIKELESIQTLNDIEGYGDVDGFINVLRREALSEEGGSIEFVKEIDAIDIYSTNEFNPNSFKYRYKNNARHVYDLFIARDLPILIEHLGKLDLESVLKEYDSFNTFRSQSVDDIDYIIENGPWQYEDSDANFFIDLPSECLRSAGWLIKNVNLSKINLYTPNSLMDQLRTVLLNLFREFVKYASVEDMRQRARIKKYEAMQHTAFEIRWDLEHNLYFDFLESWNKLSKTPEEMEELIMKVNTLLDVKESIMRNIEEKFNFDDYCAEYHYNLIKKYLKLPVMVELNIRHALRRLNGCKSV